MKAEEKEDLQTRINSDGFHYTFLHYSDFKEIKDKKFHELRKAYIKAAKRLEKFLKIRV